MSAVPASGHCMERQEAAIVHLNDRIIAKVCITRYWRFPVASFAPTWRGSACCYWTIVDTDAASASDDRVDVTRGEHGYPCSTVGIG